MLINDPTVPVATKSDINSNSGMLLQTATGSKYLKGNVLLEKVADEAKPSIDELKNDKANKVFKYTELGTVQSGHTVNTYSYSGAEYESTNVRYIVLTEGFTAGDTIYVSGRSQGNYQWSLVGFFDGETRVGGTTSTNTDYTREKFVIPEGTTEIRINGTSTSLPKLEIVSDTVDLDEVYDDVEEIKEKKANKVDVYTELGAVQSGHTVNVDSYSGAEYESSSARYIVLTEGFTPGDTIYVSGFSYGNYQWSLIGFFDGETRVGGTTSINTAYTREKFTIPAGTTEIRINGTNVDLPKIEVISGTIDIDDLAEDLEDVKADITGLDNKKANKIDVYSELGTVQSGHTTNTYTYSGTEFTSENARYIVLTEGFTEGQEIYVSGQSWGNYSWSLIGFFNGSTRLGGTTTTNTNYTREKFTIPAGTTEIRINGTNVDLPKIEVISGTIDIDDLAEDLEDVKADITGLDNKKANKIDVYSELGTVQSGHTTNTYTYSGTEFTSENARYIVLTEGFTEGQEIYVSGQSWGNYSWSLIGFFNGSTRLGGTTTTNTNYTREKFTIPAGTTEIRINGTNTNLPKVEYISGALDLFDVNTREESFEDVSRFDVNNVFKRIIDLQKQTPFTWKITEPTITFIFDDSHKDIGEIISLFRSKDVECGFATIAGKLGYPVEGGTTVKDALLAAQPYGFEVLNHGWTPITSASTEEDIINLFVNNKKALFNAGLVVDGIILAGGDGSDTFDPYRLEPYLRRYYSYSDNYGKNLNAPQYYSHNRVWLTSTLATNKGYIDSVVAGTSWSILSAHEVDADLLGTGIGLDVLEDTIDYALAQGCAIKTMRKVFNDSL